MNYDELSNTILESSDDKLAELLAPLSNEQIRHLVDELKKRADEHWQKAPSYSQTVGALVFKIGILVDDQWIQALGTMIVGDALEKLGQYPEAWRKLDESSLQFWLIKDEVGWARTWIARLAMCIDLNRVEETLSNAYKAHTILEAHEEYLKLFRLNQAIAIVFDKRGKNVEALTWYEKAKSVALIIPDEMGSETGSLYANMGVCHHLLGNLQQARDLYKSAREIYVHHQKDRAVAILNVNIASIDKLQGHYRQSLEGFYHVIPALNGHLLAQTKRFMVECYLFLNSPIEARELALEAIQIFEDLKMTYEQGLTLLYLAFAETWIEGHAASLSASQHLDEASQRFSTCFREQPEDLKYWHGMVSLYRAQIAFRQENFSLALEQAQEAGLQFRTNQQQYHYCSALLLESQVRVIQNDMEGAGQKVSDVQRIGRQIHTPSHVYSAHLIQAQIAERQERMTRATRHYTAAAAVIDRVQQRLTLSLRPVFLENKNDALSSLIRLKLVSKQFNEAFELLERMKSQAALSYLLRRSTLPVETEDDEKRSRIEEFNRLRQRLRELAQPESLEKPTDVAAKQREIATCERSLLTLSRLLEPLGSPVAGTSKQPPESTQGKIKALLSHRNALVEFYINGERITVFVMDQDSLVAYPLELPASEVRSALDGLQRYIKRTLAVGTNEPGLRRQSRTALEKLYNALILPIAPFLEGFERLTIVPYGFLHYVPFHLLRSSAQYLIEQFEVVMLPAAGLMSNRPPQRSGGALAMAWGGSAKTPLVKARDEASLVCGLLGGTSYADQKALRECLQMEPVKVLHIASHGRYHYEPDLSYIQLADGPLFTTELIQYDLSYELVTLSACETGQSRPSGGDELIGLGRGFIHAGAGALITSLWRVKDEFAYEFMDQLYQDLKAGKSKATAICNTYRKIIAQYPDEHPAFWGAFQLVGNPDPLSTILSN